MRNVIIVGIMGIWLFCVGMAQSEPITIKINGTITSIGSENLPTTLTDSIHVGDTFTGIYTYDSSVIPNIDSIGTYRYVQNAPYGIDVLMGQFEFKTNPTHAGGFLISIANEQPVNGIYDSYDIYSNQNIPLPSGFPDYWIEWLLSDSTHSALSSASLPTDAPVINNWDWSRFNIEGSNYISQGDYWQDFYIEGTVTHAFIIPEPLTSILMGAGVLLIRCNRKVLS